MKSSWQAYRERSNPLALKTIRWIALHLGRPVARMLLIPITLYFLLFAPAQRRASKLYLARVLTRKPTWLDVARHIHCFASTILDRVYLMTGQFEKLDIRFPNENMPLKYSSQGAGCILLGSHIGSFEVLRSYAVRKCPLPIKILMYEGQNPMIVQILNALNPSLSEMIIPIGAPDSLLQVRDALEMGSAVGMLGDRVMDTEGEKTVRCRLLGDTITLPVAPIVIAASLKVPIIVFFGIYLGGNRYRLHFELLGERITLSRTNRRQEIQQWMQKYADLLEKQVKAAPYNWFNFFDYWQEESGEAASKQTLTRQQLQRLLPHAGTMCLIDQVLSWTPTTICCSSRTHMDQNNPLRFNGKLSAHHLLEYGAQAMAIHGGLLKKSAHPGFLAAVRNVKISVGSLDEVDTELIITANAKVNTDHGVIYEFRITDADRNLLLSARATVINHSTAL